MNAGMQRTSRSHYIHVNPGMLGVSYGTVHIAGNDTLNSKLQSNIPVQFDRTKCCMCYSGIMRCDVWLHY